MKPCMTRLVAKFVDKTNCDKKTQEENQVHIHSINYIKIIKERRKKNVI